VSVGLPEPLLNCERQLENVKVQLETAKGEVDRPFQQEDEYADKSARVKALNILLNMDQKDKEILDMGPDDGDVEQARRSPARER
jgi:hypothetical protein